MYIIYILYLIITLVLIIWFFCLLNSQIKIEKEIKKIIKELIDIDIELLNTRKELDEKSKIEN